VFAARFAGALVAVVDLVARAVLAGAALAVLLVAFAAPALAAAVFFAAAEAVFFAAALATLPLATCSLKLWPGRNAGTEVFFTFTDSPVRGFLAVRAARTRFSKT